MLPSVRKSTLLYCFSAIVLLTGAVPGEVLGRQLPPGVTPEQALQALQDNPDLVARVRQRLAASGLSTNEIRSRLRAAGYPANSLDQFLLEAGAGGGPRRGPEVLEALSVFGVAGLTRRDSLELSGDTLALRLFADSLRADSVRREAGGSPTLPLFGEDIFRRATTQFQPVLTGPVPDGYRVGPGDELVMFLTGDVELSRTLLVTREGFVLVPDVGLISVTNLTIDQLRSVLRDRLASSYSGIQSGATQLDLTVTRVRTNTVFVAGEVSRPGAYQLAATASALSVLYEAGGLTEQGNFRELVVRRGDELVATVDLYDYLLRGQIPQLALESGDVLFVPVRGPRVTIVGEVHRPGIYEVTDGEVLADMVVAAGGLSTRARLDRATVSRFLPPDQRTSGRNRVLETVNLSHHLDDGNGYALRDGDSITVFRINGPMRNTVSIAGSVWQPGTYERTDGMRLSDLLEVAGGVRPEVFAGRAQIVRLMPDSTRQLLGVVLSRTTGQPDENYVLADDDAVLIHSATEFQPARWIAVYGAVSAPGIQTFADSMTLRDAVLGAGGLRDGASIQLAEISRPVTNPGRNGDTLAVVLRVPLDSSFVFNRRALDEVPASLRAPEVPLRPYDNVFIRQNPGFRPIGNVSVTGEVAFPGSYTIVSRAERLVDVIQRAGGLTDQAFANGIRFFRPEGHAGRISIDLPAALRDPGHKDNVLMRPGDSIDIPLLSPIVRVDGEVLSPTSVAFVPGANTQYYVDAAGGFSNLADKGKTFIQQPNGLIERKGARPEPGAVVTVPAKDPNNRGVDVTALLTTLGSFMISITTLIVLLDTRNP